MISVALCTYNGSSFVREQIHSILDQTRSVDEIVVCDDGSTDATLEIIEGLKDAADIPIRIYQNEKNLGFKENFFQAIHLCQGDLVFLSDQDDVWFPNKVDSIVRWFDTHSSMQVVFTDAYLMDENGRDLDETLWQRFGFDKRKQSFFDKGYALDIWAWSSRATGATMAMKRQFVESLDWRDRQDAFHDRIIAMQGILSRTIGFIDEKTICYRLSESQACGASHLPRELYCDPLVPCPKDKLDIDLDGLPEKARKHVEFIGARASLKNSWFGIGQIRYYPSYFQSYRGWAYKFICHDWWMSVKHSFKRIFK